ncbi:MAG: hypothetical protein AAB657_02350 [Patescibacteria group bacterium]
MNIIGLKQLRQDTTRYAELVSKGQSFLIIKRSKPLFKIVPADTISEVWEEVIDFTKIKKGGVVIKDLLARL